MDTRGQQGLEDNHSEHDPNTQGPCLWLQLCGRSWALCPVQSLTQWPSTPVAPSQGQPMASSGPGASVGLILTRPGSYYSASWVIRSDTGSRDVFHPVSEQMFLGPQTPGKSLKGRILAASAFDLPSPSFPVLNLG